MPIRLLTLISLNLLLPYSISLHYLNCPLPGRIGAAKEQLQKWEYYLTQVVSNLVQTAESRNLGPRPRILRIFLSKRNKNYSEYKLNLETFIFLSLSYLVQLLYSLAIQLPIQGNVYPNCDFPFQPNRFYSLGAWHNNGNSMHKILQSQCNTHKASYFSITSYHKADSKCYTFFLILSKSA